MYRYYKSSIDGNYKVVFDNPLVGCVDDSQYDNESDAINRVNEMNKSRKL